MEAITLSHVRIPSINIGGICLPGIGAPGSIGKKGLIWPTGMKEHIKAWYDPKKQGMTNFDVIEAYVEDFTNWNYVKARGVATISQHKFIITECILKGLSIVEDIQEPYSNLTVRIIGITDNQEVLITDYVNGQHQIINTITEDGIYTIEDRHHFVGFGCNFVGTCNITIEQLPTSILKDLSGNGNHAYLYGGKGKLNSGMGVYQQDFSKLIISRVDKKQDPFSFTVSGSGGSYLAYMQLGNWNNKAFKILVNINAERDYLHLRFRNNTDAVITSVALKNGENIIPAQNIEGATKAVFEYSLKEGETITITQIPDYPDQLCYDGKMYAVCYGFPILTDYTVMAERTWFERQNRACFLSKITTSGTGAFGFEFYNEYNEDTTYSFGRANNVEYFKDGITYQITNSYNGIVKLDYIVNGKDNAELYIGKLRPSERPAFIGCHGTIIVADRSFTEEEINWLKQNWDKI
ncbi:hypothetical protein [Bacteroides clarus]|uniref:hypothetical protein n=1 Tax=Bacteroides clarus TaxID=626929 RepID=UPI0018AC6033|nr:hypothetical protein [Bacteroides clarus]